MQGRPLGPGSQLPPRHLDPPQHKQQHSSSQASAFLNQPTLKTYLESLVPQAVAPDPPREQSALGAFPSSFSLNSFPAHGGLRQAEALLQQAVRPPQATGAPDIHGLLSPTLSNGLAGPDSPLQTRSRRAGGFDGSSVSVKGESASSPELLWPGVEIAAAYSFLLS